MADQLAELLRLEPLLGPSPSGPQLSNISDRNPFFTSREQFLGELREALANRGRAALSGSGGIGKTQTAVEYAHQHSVEYAYAFWATAASREALLSSYVVIAGLLKLPEFDAKKQTLIVEVVMRWLASHDRWLLILDNVDRPDTIKPFIPLKPTGHIVLTSRAQVFDAIGIVKPVELNVMSSEEGQTFPLKRTGRKEHSRAELNAASELTAELAFLPLALEQAGAFIVESHSLFQDYLRSFAKRRLELLDKHGTSDLQVMSLTFLQGFVSGLPICCVC